MDFAGRDGIHPPAQRVSPRMIFGLRFEVGCDPDHVNAPQRGFNRLLARALE